MKKYINFILSLLVFIVGLILISEALTIDLYKNKWLLLINGIILILLATYSFVRSYKKLLNSKLP